MKERKRLNDALVKSLPVPANGPVITYDSDLPGFGVRVTPAGARSYVLNYRIDGRERRYTIGSAAEWSCGAARKHAADLKAGIRLGTDPLEELERRREAVTMAGLCDRFVADHLPRLRPATRQLYLVALNGSASRKGIRAHFRHRRVDEVTHVDVEDFHRYVSRRAPLMANRSVAVLSRMLSLAVRWGIRPDNPARGIERNPETKRTRYLSPRELVTLSQALGGLADQQAANIFRILVLTGARKREVLSARWEDVDLEAGVWTKPAATTKQRSVHRVPLAASAVALLSDIERTGPWLFPGKVEGEHRVEVKAQWEAVCRAAGLVDAAGRKTVRIHDLRHTYASVLASAGLSLPVIGALLGHSEVSTTQRYAHLMDDPLRQATERAAAVLTGAASAEVVDLPSSKRG
jgi:integrase